VKSSKMSRLAAIAVMAILAVPTRLAAQATQEEEPKHHHYKVVEIGTFGGPNFYTNFSGAQDRLLNNRGTLVGGADTSLADPYCFDLFPFGDCSAQHAFAWSGGILTDLGTLPGGTNSQAFWVNDAGIIAGLAQNAQADPAMLGFPVPIGDQAFHAAVWSHGKITDLGTFGGYLSIAQAVNNRGQVVGLAQNNIPETVPSILNAIAGGFIGPGFFLDTQFRAFLWENGIMRDLGTLGGPEAWARTINDRGQVAGVSFTDSILQPVPGVPTGLPTTHAFLWEEAKMTDLGSLGGTQSDVEGINNRGQVIGEMTLPGDNVAHPFFWDGGKLTDLGTFGGPFGLAIGLNEAGEVVGTACNQNCQAQFGFLWKNGVLTNLGTAPGDDCSVAQQVNARGQAVGPSFACSVFFSDASDATLYEHGSAINLNDFVPSGSNFHLTGLDSYINDRGEIAVIGALSNGDHHAFLLVPCDEDHLGIEGCDYSPFEPPAVSPAPAAALALQNPTASKSSVSVEASQTMRPLRNRLIPSSRGLGMQGPK
jgi:probable HAF family extracellular repeat protein